MKGAIFDMDGLLIDSERVWQGEWYALAAEMGVTLADTFPRDMCGTGGEQTLAVIRRYYPVEDAAAVLRECTERVYVRQREGVPLRPGVETILRGLRGEGYRIAVASSSPMDMIEHNLRVNGIEEYFTVFTSGREVKRCKPEPDIFLLAAERLGLPPEECYVFEDSLNGVEAGWRAGCRAVMIPDLIQPSEEAKKRCFGIYPDLAAAWEHLRSGNDAI